MRLLLALIFFVSASQALSGAGAGRHAEIRAVDREKRSMNNLPPREPFKRRGDTKPTDWKKRSNNSLNRLRMEKKQRKRVPQGAMPALGLTVRMVGKTDDTVDPNDGHLHKRSSSKSTLAPEDGRLHKRAKSNKLPSYDGRNHKRRMSVPVDHTRRHRTLFESKAKRNGKRHYPQNDKNKTSSSPDDSYSRNEAMPNGGESYSSDTQNKGDYAETATATVTADETSPTEASEYVSAPVPVSAEESSSSSSTSSSAKSQETPSSKNSGSDKSENTPSYGSSSGSGSGSGYSGNSGSGSSSGSSDSGYGSSNSGGSSDTSSYSGSGSSSSDVTSGSSDSSSGGSYSGTTSSTADDDEEDCEDDEDDTADDDDEEDCDDSDDTEETTTTSSNVSSSGSSSSSYGDDSSNTTSSSGSSSDSSEASSGGMSYSGDATYYLQNNNAGSCGNKASDSDMVVAIKTSIYSAGAKCGDKVTLTNTANGATASAVVADTCPTCNGDGIDLSEGLFKALSNNNLGLGVLKVKYVISS